MSEKTQFMIGKLLNEEAERDAIHIAVEPVIAAGHLKAGDHIGLLQDGSASRNATKKIGIVDPYVTGSIKTGTRFFMFLYPNTITSLRHVWTHPDLADVEDASSRQFAAALLGSEKWLRDYASEHEVSYERLLAGGKDYIESNGNTLIHIGVDIDYGESATFWEHYGVVTGEVVPEGVKGAIFSCAC